MVANILTNQLYARYIVTTQLHAKINILTSYVLDIVYYIYIY